MIDPLHIVNDFFRYTGDIPWPAMTPFDDYWGKKVCALADRCAKAENELAALQKKIKRDEPKKELTDGEMNARQLYEKYGPFDHGN